MVVSALLAAWSLQKGGFATDKEPPWRPSFEEAIPRPTGANGYEEYLRAADIVSNPVSLSFARYEGYLMARSLGGFPDEAPPRPVGVAENATLLDVQREHVRRCGQALDLVERGNGKPVFDPREKVDGATTFPELAGLKEIAKFAVTNMRVCFADGQPDRAVAIAQAVLTMRSRMPSTTLITEVVGIVIDSIVFAAINENTDRISERGWTRLEAVANQRLATNRYPEAMKAELASSLTSLKALKNGSLTGDQFGTETDPNTQAIVASYNKLSPAQRDLLYERIASSLIDQYRAIFERLDGPEAEWANAPPPEETKYDGTLGSLAASLAGLVCPVFNQSAIAAIKNRTQLRLLKLHSLIQTFRWHHGHLPDKLSNAAPKDCLDPLTAQEYVYESGAAGYKLASKGIRQTGEIELRYRRSTSAPRDPNDPPVLAHAS